MNNQFFKRKKFSLIVVMIVVLISSFSIISYGDNTKKDNAKKNIEKMKIEQENLIKEIENEANTNNNKDKIKEKEKKYKDLAVEIAKEEIEADMYDYGVELERLLNTISAATADFRIYTTEEDIGAENFKVLNKRMDELDKIVDKYTKLYEKGDFLSKKDLLEKLYKDYKQILETHMPKDQKQ